MATSRDPFSVYAGSPLKTYDNQPITSSKDLGGGAASDLLVDTAGSASSGGGDNRVSVAKGASIIYQAKAWRYVFTDGGYIVRVLVNLPQAATPWVIRLRAVNGDYWPPVAGCYSGNSGQLYDVYPKSFFTPPSLRGSAPSYITFVTPVLSEGRYKVTVFDKYQVEYVLTNAVIQAVAPPLFAHTKTLMNSQGV